MTRYRCRFDRHGKLAEWEDDELVWLRPGAFEDEPDESPQVMRDLAPYRSMIDGSVIDGRKRHRDHLRAHNCVEVGNDTSHMKQKPIFKTSNRETLHRILADVGERDLHRMIKQEIRNRR